MRNRDGRSGARPWLAITAAALLAACSDAGSTSLPPETPAVLADRARDAATLGDFVRILLVPSGVVPSALGLPDAYRVFASASDFFAPPIEVARAVDYPGLPYRADRDLVVLRCSPPDPGTIEPILATWPNVLAAIRSDLDGPYTCPPTGESPESEIYCIAREYADFTSTTVIEPIAHALTSALPLFETTARQEVMVRRFGIYPAFSGLGFAVKGTGSGPAITAATALRDSVVPEYLLRNASLGDAGCVCLIVPPYEGRDTALLDLDFVAERGGLGACRVADRLPEGPDRMAALH